MGFVLVYVYTIFPGKCVFTWIINSEILINLLFSHFQSVTIHTDVGDVKIELFCEYCPKACEVR